jgi:hypothetical protein
MASAGRGWPSECSLIGYWRRRRPGRAIPRAVFLWRVHVASAASEVHAGRINFAVVGRKNRPMVVSIAIQPKPALKTRARPLPSFIIASIDTASVVAIQHGPVDWSTLLN